MIVYDQILQRLSDAGWSQYRLLKERQLGNGTITRIRLGQSISTDTLDVICRLCECQPGDLIHFEDGERNE